jgi:hypothetical protein
MIGAVWLLSLPFRLLAAFGLRRSVIVACLLVLAVTAYGVAEDLGLVEPPAHAAPAPKPAAGQLRPSRAAIADIPAGYLRLFRGRDLPGPLVGAGGHRQGRVRPRPAAAARSPLGPEPLPGPLGAPAALLRRPDAVQPDRRPSLDLAAARARRRL